MKPFSNQNSKKTRDLPNLSQCQSCNFRIDICSGNSTLNTLFSEWRIVLLCKDCFFLVQSSQICSYCFKEPSSEKPCYNCCICNRIVHKNCVLEHGFVAPWSYCCSSSDSFTCVDCWLPKSLANKRRVPRSGKKRKFLESRSFKESYEEVSVESALIARQLAVRKALVARGAVDAVDLIAKDGNSGGDTQFAMQLHRAMNSSPRIVEKFRAANSSSFSQRRLPECNDETVANLSGENNSCHSAERQFVCGISRNFLCDSLEHVDFLTPNGADTVMMRQTANVADLGLRQKEGDERCPTNKLINMGVNDYSSNCASQFLRQENEILIPEGERRYVNRDGCSMKYSRRKLNEMSTPGSKPLSFYECRRHETQPSTIEPLQKESTLFPNSMQCSSPKVAIRSNVTTPQLNSTSTFGRFVENNERTANVENLKSQLKKREKCCSNKFKIKCCSCMNSSSQSFREGNAIMLPEDERRCRQADRFFVKYRRRKFPIQYLMKYSRRKLNKRNRACTSMMRSSTCVENSELQPDEGCYSKWINSSVNYKNISTASQYFRKENVIMIPEEEKCCYDSDKCLTKYSRRKLNKRDDADMLRMGESANVEKSESQPEESCYEKWMNSSRENKNTNSTSQSYLKENKIMVPEDEAFCRRLDRYLIKYNRRKLPSRYLMKYRRRMLNKMNVADTPKMRRTANVGSSESQPKEEEESCSSRLMNSGADDDSGNSASQSYHEEDEIAALENESCNRHPILFQEINIS